MASTVTAAVLHEPHGQFVFEQVDLDELHPDEALVRVEASGICHTDIGAQDLLPMPAVLGHEGTGVVEQVGAAVTQINTGDQVIMSYGHCGACPNCQDGLIYICENSVQGNFGGRRYDGSPTVLLNNEPVSAAFFQQSSFASHAVVPARDDRICPVPAGDSQAYSESRHPHARLVATRHCQYDYPRHTDRNHAAVRRAERRKQ